MEKTIVVMECLMPEFLAGLGQLWADNQVIKIYAMGGGWGGSDDGGDDGGGDGGSDDGGDDGGGGGGVGNNEDDSGSRQHGSCSARCCWRGGSPSIKRGTGKWISALWLYQV